MPVDKSFVIGLLLLMMNSAHADGWKVGLAKRIITPTEPLWMAGYAARTKPAEGKLQDLWIRTLAIEDPQGNEGVILSADVVGISRYVWDAVIDRLGEEFDRSQLMFNSSHTHSGPVFGGTLSDMYPLDETQKARVQAYTASFIERSVEAIQEARQKKSPAHLAIGQGTATFAANRRNNPEAEVPARRSAGTLVGPFDHSVPVLRLTHPDGGLRAVVFLYACHNTVLDGYEWSGDYAGFAQDKLERDHPGIQAMFVAGCGGDQNPLPRRKVALAEQYGNELAAAVDKVLSHSMREVKGSLDTRMELVSCDLGERPTREDLEKRVAGPADYQQRWASRILSDIKAGKPPLLAYSVPVQRWRVGDLLWISMGGEVVVDYALQFKALFGPETWVSAYSNDVMAYIPTRRVLLEGGYEGRTAMIPYGMPAYQWADSIEDRLTQSALRLVRGPSVTQP
ncbi:neutral/alkaline non-lysosomal ceramidase N-terminal domain-containing protein [bacterium]|nr:neutral/alkaline non-lysosomal ceramidase N-terminal domain-containing protein [bacterium]